MTMFEKFMALILLCAAAYIITFVGTAEGNAQIKPIMIGEWRVGRAYITTSPEGDRKVCELGEYSEALDRSIAIDDVYLMCIPFVDAKPHVGKPDGRLVELLDD